MGPARVKWTRYHERQTRGTRMSLTKMTGVRPKNMGMIVPPAKPVRKTRTRWWSQECWAEGRTRMEAPRQKAKRQIWWFGDRKREVGAFVHSSSALCSKSHYIHAGVEERREALPRIAPVRSLPMTTTPTPTIPPSLHTRMCLYTLSGSAFCLTPHYIHAGGVEERREARSHVPRLFAHLTGQDNHTPPPHPASFSANVPRTRRGTA